MATGHEYAVQHILLNAVCCLCLQPGSVLLHGAGVGADTQMTASPKAPALPSTSLPPQAAHEAQALANASENLKAQAQTLKVMLHAFVAYRMCHIPPDSRLRALR